MKVAVSIPDPIFEEAEQLAKRLNTSRSALYAQALGRFVADYAPDSVTEAMNAAEDGPRADAFTREAARRLLKFADW